MKNRIYLLLMMLAMGIASCDIIIKPDTNNITTNVDSVVVNVRVIGDTVAAEQDVALSECDMAMLDNGKLFFYCSSTNAMVPYEAETDSVVNCVFTQDGYLYYCVPVNKRMMLRRVNLEESSPQPEQVADWGLDYEKCVTETYGTVSPLVYYAGRHTLGLYYEFSWDTYALTEHRLYNMDNGQITEWDYDTWHQGESDNEDEDDTQYESVPDEVQEYLQNENGQYWFKDGTPVCLTDKIDFKKYISDPDYYEGPDFEYVSSAPDNSKVLYMAILEWGDYPHGVLAISSLDGTFQLPLEDTDCTGFNAKWLDDGSLVYVGISSSPDDSDNDVSWHNSSHCIKRIYPDGTTKIISSCGDFQLKPTTNF